jgi:hypothetical protein
MVLPVSPLHHAHLLQFFVKAAFTFQLKSFCCPTCLKALREGSHKNASQKINGGELMDAATTKQKAYVRDLFVRCGVPKWIFNPLKLWNISKGDADLLINGLRIMKEFNEEDLKEVIWQRLQNKSAIQKITRTVDELEEKAEEQATYDPTTEDWLDQQTYDDDIPQKEWIQEWKAETLAEKEAAE